MIVRPTAVIDNDIQNARGNGNLPLLEKLLEERSNHPAFRKRRYFKNKTMEKQKLIDQVEIDIISLIEHSDVEFPNLGGTSRPGPMAYGGMKLINDLVPYIKSKPEVMKMYADIMISKAFPLTEVDAGYRVVSNFKKGEIDEVYLTRKEAERRQKILITNHLCNNFSKTIKISLEEFTPEWVENKFSKLK